MIVTKRAASMATLLTGLALLAGCSAKNNVQSKFPVYAVDLSGGAKLCEVPSVSPAPGKTTAVTMKVGNDGGWCGISVHQDGPKPYDAGLLTARPDHGTVTVHSVGDNTRIDYVPDRGYAGPDTFSVSLLPGEAAVKVAVAVVKS